MSKRSGGAVRVRYRQMRRDVELGLEGATRLDDANQARELNKLRAGTVLAQQLHHGRMILFGGNGRRCPKL